MIQNSVWNKYSILTETATLSSDIKVDVAIIGAGVTGLTCAQLLSSQGLSVAVLESGKVGELNTGHSTGNLYSAYGQLLTTAYEKHGEEIISKIISSRDDAINFIEKNVEKLNIDCDFKRVPWTYFSTVEEKDKTIQQSLENAQKLGLKVSSAKFTNTPFQARVGMKMAEQAQFNPLRYAQGLASAISCQDCLIFEKTRVNKIEDKKDHSLLHTDSGVVTASYVIQATHTPLGLMTYHTTLGPYREYGIACKVGETSLKPGIYFGYFDQHDITSIRVYEREGDKYIIVVGQPHKVGQGDSEARMRELEKIARDTFDVKTVDFRWGGQHYRPADERPYIGPKTHGSQTYVATGFATHGLVYGTVAGKIISDLITGQKNEYAEVYDSGRFTPVKAAPKFIKENVNVFFQYLKDYTKSNPTLFADVHQGDGQVLEHDGHKLAVHRDELNQLQVCSAICTHLGCVVHWNNAEKSWDCPCHGSRFETNGAVIEGPAMKALESFSVDEVLNDDSKAAEEREHSSSSRV